MPKRFVLEITPEQIKAMLVRGKAALPEDDFKLVHAMAEVIERSNEILRDRHASVARMRRLFGLGRSEKTADLRAKAKKAASEAAACGASQNSTAATTPAEATTEPLSTTEPPAMTPTPPEAKPKRKGHGRIPSSAYRAAEHIAVPHESLQHGDPCPDCAMGNVYDLPCAPILRIVGQAPLWATCWDAGRVRCGACGTVFTAQLPAEAQGEKYDETAVSMIAVLHCGNGMPFHRLDKLQSNLDTPVPASTQWEVLQQAVPLVEPAYNELVRLAAQAELLHIDDSHMRILSLMGKRREQLIANGQLDTPERTGLYTTAIIAVVAVLGVIALFFTGRKHAGENLAALLTKRAKGLPLPLVMSDALPHNVPEGLQVIESNCLAHGRRKFVDEFEDFPQECLHVLGQLGLVYKLDNECKHQRVSDAERLRRHQLHSAPIMDALQKWMTEKIDAKLIEPNSGLGRDFNYFLKRWEKFTVFLRVPGAPLDNNICERGLKMAIRLRKASLFYRSERGARVGDIYMTLIHTAELHGQNPFDYLTELQRNHKAVAETPADWLPWTYKATLTRIRLARASPPAGSTTSRIAA